MKIKIDSREQQPYQFKSPSEVGTVPVGDYSICGLENHIFIEGNEFNDLIGSLAAGREWFERELYEIKPFDHFALVTEVNWSRLGNGDHGSHTRPIARELLRTSFVNAFPSCKKRLSKTVNN